MSVYGFATLDDFQRVNDAVRQIERERPPTIRQHVRIPALAPFQLGVYNGESSADCPAYGIVITDGIQSRTGGPVFGYLPKVKRPDTFGCQTNFFIARREGITHAASGPIQDGDGDQYVIAYDDSDGTPAANESWGPRSGTFLLKKNTGGFTVLGVVDNANHYVLVKSSPMLAFVGKTDAAHASGATGTISIWAGAPGSESDTTVNMTGVYNRFCDLGSGAWVRCCWDWCNSANKWEIAPGAP